MPEHYDITGCGRKGQGCGIYLQVAAIDTGRWIRKEDAASPGDKKVALNRTI